MGRGMECMTIGRSEAYTSRKIRHYALAVKSLKITVSVEVWERGVWVCERVLGMLIRPERAGHRRIRDVFMDVRDRRSTVVLCRLGRLQS